VGRHLVNICTILNKSKALTQPNKVVEAKVPDDQTLTKKEAQVVLLLCQGKGTGEIATELCISSLAVYKHVENIFKKLQVQNRQQLLLKLL
jgi:DNA-binding CsgD family transcriptional regulator